MSTTQVAVVDSATGEQVGSTITFSDSDGISASYHGSQAVITVNGIDGQAKTVVVDTATGAQIVAPPPSIPPVQPFPEGSYVSADGTRAVVATKVANNTQLTVIDTATGAQVGSPLTLLGDASGFVPGVDGQHVVAVTSVSDPTAVGGLLNKGPAARMAVIDLSTGKQVGNTLKLFGSVGPIVDGNPVWLNLSPALGLNTRLAVFDTETGKNGSHPVTVAGEGGELLINKEGTRVVILTSRRPASPSGNYATMIHVAALGGS